MKKVQKIAIMTGGGDCPGLNPVIRAVVKTAISKYGLENHCVCCFICPRCACSYKARAQCP